LPPVVETPCVNVCQIEPASHLCRGCGRSLIEIANWAAIGPEGRLKVLEDLLVRMMRLQRDGLALPPRERTMTEADAKPFRYKFKRRK
jgi:uncharacterized protein